MSLTQLLIRLGLTVATALTGVAQAQGYFATDLGSLGGGSTTARGLNASGQVVGYSSIFRNGEFYAFMTGANGVGMVGLNLADLRGQAAGINDLGAVVGTTSSYQEGVRGFVTGPGGVGITFLNPFGTSYANATAINASGQVVGSATLPDGRDQAYITGANGVGAHGLGTLGGPDSHAYGINAAGQVVGFSDMPGNFAAHAFMTGPNGAGMIDLGTLGPPSYSVALGINDAGQVVGDSHVLGAPYLPTHAFVTGPNGVGMVDLGTFGGQFSTAFDINNSGQVVGYARTAQNTSRAFISVPNVIGLIDLNSLVTLPDGDVLSSAVAINDAGQIAANSAAGRAYLLSPVPESSVLWMFGAGLPAVLTFMRGRLKTGPGQGRQ